MVHFRVPVLNNVCWQPGDKEPEEQEVIQNKAINEVSLLNDEQLIGRWRYNYEMDRIDLEHELLAVDLTKVQLIGTIEVLASYTSTCGFLQARCGGMSWVEWTLWERGKRDTAIDSAMANRTAADPASRNI